MHRCDIVHAFAFYEFRFKAKQDREVAEVYEMITYSYLIFFEEVVHSLND